jgi:hypothetical protein
MLPRRTRANTASAHTALRQRSSPVLWPGPRRHPFFDGVAAFYLFVCLFTYFVLVFGFVSSFPDSVISFILWCSQSGDDITEDLAKFGYKLNMNVKVLNILLEFLLPTWTMYRNLAIFLRFCVEFWLSKISKQMILALSILLYYFSAIYIQPKKCYLPGLLICFSFFSFLWTWWTGNEPNLARGQTTK